ncbi:hypothetical protein O3G_MSEX004159 [Manduca sexta]|uniref:Major facilitator superfamily (MFS) profile domain-containing protein n=1 Tax=Manduca sexta TaxID=7130 RepID=A0A921YW28_MANSE|nr:hypothetical protein O3G_MSEX004159 [Manduca sexta]
MRDDVCVSKEADCFMSKAQCSWVVSLHSAGALLGCYIGQILNERVGRRWTLLGSAVPGLLGACFIIFTAKPEVMYVARFLMGSATGIAAVVTMIYVTEIADKEIRGALGMTVQIMNNLGSLIMYGIGPFVSYTALNSILVSIPICYSLACLWIPESPYYHLKDGRLDAAKKEFRALNSGKDEKTIDEQLAVMRSHVLESMENKTTVKELFTNMRYRKALYVVGGLKLLQYMTGIFVIQSYVEVIFRQSRFVSGPIASIVYGFVQILAGICATFLTHRLGRRILMFISCLGVAISMTIVGVYFYLVDRVKIEDPTTLASLAPMPLIGIFGFNILYANGIGNLPYVMQAELFPVNVKAVASSIATMLVCVLGFLVTLCYQSIKDILGHYTVFWSFAFVGYVGVVFIYYCVPETKDKTLEEVQDNITERPPESEALRTKKDDDV